MKRLLDILQNSLESETSVPKARLKPSVPSFALILVALLSTSIYAKQVALLVETASGGLINSDKDVITIKRLLGNSYEIITLNQAQATSTRLRKELINIAKKKLTPEDTFLF